MLKPLTDDHIIQLLCAALQVTPALLKEKGSPITMEAVVETAVQLAKALKDRATQSL